LTRGGLQVYYSFCSDTMMLSCDLKTKHTITQT